jgi:hypothetical protein
MAKYAILATISLMANVIAFYSIVANIYSTHQTQSYTWFSLAVNVCSQLLLIIYGIANHAPEIYVPTTLLLIGLSYIIYDKYYHHHMELSREMNV